MEKNKIKNIISKWKPVLGLSDWDIKHKLINQKQNEFKEQTAIAYIKYDCLRKMACIFVAKSKRVDRCKLEEVVLHEILHLRYYGVKECFDEIVNNYVRSKKTRKIYQEQLSTRIEILINDTAKMLISGGKQNGV